MKIKKFEFNMFGINTYVVYDPATRDCAIIDPGMMNRQEEEALDSFIAEEGLHVCHVINTHLHIDHAIGNAYAAGRYGVPVLAHKSDEPLGQALPEQAQSFHLRIPAQRVSITQYINDGDVIKIGEGRLRAIHVPGHSPGSIVLYDEADGFILAGDVLFQGSIGRTDLPGGSLPTLLQGIKSRLFTLPDDTVVYPGHGPKTTIGIEKRTNPFF